MGNDGRNVPDYGSHVIAERVFAFLLSAFGHIREGQERTESGIFDYHGLRGIALKGKTIGILGTGKIGRKVAKIAYEYKMHILVADQCRMQSDVWGEKECQKTDDDTANH